MEVAEHWRREWAGTAEYGKVTEGGVTRRVARAMEVLNASGPGARVRVMRAAYHSTAGPGVPASSYMLHSSRRVISSGFNLLESPTLPSKPLEISSTPLDAFRDLSTEKENYKVTEPDDTEISEPSKWRVAPSGVSVRMPSEESSSTDNASIIDLDSRSAHRNVFRKYSYDSENSDILLGKRNSARASPLLEAPSTLSTLKFKSLLNGSNDWNNRRKSYSFEDTSPGNDTIVHSNDTLAMESSTDSGICKSSEIVNDQTDDHRHSIYSERNKTINELNDEPSFKDWLHKHRPNQFYKGTHLKPFKEHETTPDDNENNVTLQSTGKVSITVPITIEKEEKQYITEEADRRVKRVEFCKTELHFAAESGRVNIIATDEKPPPSNDFRKKRSAFIPITDKFEKPITLFGERGDFTESIKSNHQSSTISTIESNSFEESENTAATKSILKNKIPKPKPYLLGENMVFGSSEDLSDKDRLNNDTFVPQGVSLINKQLQIERKFSNEAISTFSNAIDASQINIRTTKKGPSISEGYDDVVIVSDNDNNALLTNNSPVVNNNKSIRNKLNVQPLSPDQKPKTRKLRETDLMYFGIDNERKINTKDKTKYVESILTSHSSLTNDTLQSVKLIKQISNSVCNSEGESSDTPEYQNISRKSFLTPTPKPRLRSKYDKTTEIRQGQKLQPLFEQPKLNIATHTVQETRQSRSKKYEDVVIPTPRSRSEPSKKRTNVAVETIRDDQMHSDDSRRGSITQRSHKHQVVDKRTKKPSQTTDAHKSHLVADDTSLYTNLNIFDEEKKKHSRSAQRQYKSEQKRGTRIDTQAHHHGIQDTNDDTTLRSNHKSLTKSQYNVLNKRDSADDNLNKSIKSVKSNKSVHRTKKLVTPENSFNSHTKPEEAVKNRTKISSDECRHRSHNNTSSKNKETTSIQRRSNKIEALDGTQNQSVTIAKEDNPVPKVRAKYISKENANAKTDTLKIHNHINETMHNHVLPKVINDIGKDSAETVSKKASHKTPRRSEYVINYDDKNGTVSSVCKIKPGHNLSKRKKDSPKEIKVKTKTTIDKTPLRK